MTLADKLPQPIKNFLTGLMLLSAMLLIIAILCLGAYGIVLLGTWLVNTFAPGTLAAMLGTPVGVWLITKLGKDYNRCG